MDKLTGQLADVHMQLGEASKHHGEAEDALHETRQKLSEQQKAHQSLLDQHKGTQASTVIMHTICAQVSQGYTTEFLAARQ